MRVVLAVLCLALLPSCSEAFAHPQSTGLGGPLATGGLGGPVVTDALGGGGASSPPAADPCGDPPANGFDYWLGETAASFGEGNDVTSWVSAGTNGATMSQDGANNYPDYELIGGVHVVHFDTANSESLDESTGSTTMYDFLHHQAEGGSLVAVVQMVSANPNAIMPIACTSDFSGSSLGFCGAYEDRASVGGRNDRWRTHVHDGGGAACGPETANDVFTTQAWHIVTLNSASGTPDEMTSTIEVDQADTAAATCDITNTSASSNALHFGINGGETLSFADMYLAGLAILDTDDAATLGLWETYLNCKTGAGVL